MTTPEPALTIERAHALGFREGIKAAKSNLNALVEGYDRLQATDRANAVMHAIGRLDNLLPTDAPDELAELRAENDRLREALNLMLLAVCSETGFVQAVRCHSGLAYPWEALDIAEAKARAALMPKEG